MTTIVKGGGVVEFTSVRQSTQEKRHHDNRHHHSGHYKQPRTASEGPSPAQNSHDGNTGSPDLLKESERQAAKSNDDFAQKDDQTGPFETTTDQQVGQTMEDGKSNKRESVRSNVSKQTVPPSHFQQRSGYVQSRSIVQWCNATLLLTTLNVKIRICISFLVKRDRQRAAVSVIR